MGLDVNAVKFLIAARKSGVEFGDIVTLGRRDLNVYAAKMKALLESHGFSGVLLAPGAADSRPKMAQVPLGLTCLLHVAKIDFLIYYNLSMKNRRNFRPVKTT